MNTVALPQGWTEDRALRAVGTGLWVFIGVACVLFTLFIVAYGMRMDMGTEWSPIAMPWQLVLSTALLVAGSVLLERSAADARALRLIRARRLWLAGGAAAAAFLCSQVWAWQSLVDARVVLATNPAASFFYVLTAMHGLHVIGGLIAWSVVAKHVLPAAAEPRNAAARIALTARYWHFLLAVWVALYAALGWLTPEIVRFICGRG
ncbi:MAG: cytochrome c oxidase subunit 3 [Rubrivivax sp.]|nr:cytochrome c oxidase subunit 3 [Rubrivivax sp.]